MSAPIQIGILYPPIPEEFNPPEHPALPAAIDPELQAALEEEFGTQDRYLGELWQKIAAGINWAGALRVEETTGRLYRYETDHDEWMSFDRPLFFFGEAAPPSPAGYLEFWQGIASGAAAGYYLPQDCVAVRWWGSWTTGASVGATFNLRATGAIKQTWTAAGAETNFSEEILANASAGDFLAIDMAGDAAGITNLVIGVELAWRAVFPA